MRPAGYFESEALAAGFDPTMARSMGAFVARVMDQQAIDERLNYQWIADNMGGGGDLRPATVIVAAVNSTDAEKAGADIVCDGVADDVDVQAACALAAASGWGGQVLLLSGHFTFASYVNIPLSVTVRGLGTGTYITGADLFRMADFGIGLTDVLMNATGDAVFVGGAQRCYMANLHVMAGRVKLNNGTRIVNSYLDELAFVNGFSVASGCVIVSDTSPAQAASVVFDAASYRNRMVGCYVQTQDGVAVYLGGGVGNGSNAVSSCTIISTMPVDNTGETVTIDGDENSFTDNIVRSNGVAAVSRPQYGVEVQAGATAARVRLNDLRPGAGAWGTGAYNDLGAGTLASLNDI